MSPCSPPAGSRLALVAGLAAIVVLGGFAPTASGVSARTAARESSSAVAGAKTFRAPGRVTHIAVHWRGGRQARVWVAFSRDGERFGPRRRVELDEVDEIASLGETYGAVMLASGVRAVRVYSDRRLGRLTVLWLTDRGEPVRPVAAAATVGQPTVVPRVDWGADESLRFDSRGKEIWPPTFSPVQKLIVHNTETQNKDPDPAATIRSIHYYHAVTRGWGDIGYNFLIDEAGRVYEGRHSFDYPSGSSPTGEDLAGNGVTGAHAYGFNAGTVGVALLGTLKNRDATPAARDALERLLTWESERRRIDPQGSSRYTNPVNGTRKRFANIAGHRDVGDTDCPGGVFYSTLPQIRADVAAMVTGSPPFLPPVAPRDFSLKASPIKRTVTRGRSTVYAVTIAPSGGFTGSVRLSVRRLPDDATATLRPNPATRSSTLTVQTSRSTPTGNYRLTIRGASGNMKRSTTARLTVKRRVRR